MSVSAEYQIAQGAPVSAHSFNTDRSQLCVSINSSEAQILQKQGAEWKTVETLAEHDKVITSIDWAPNTNRIVTCSQDRNAYVWKQAQDPQTGATVWKPTLVLLRINRAATFVRWSPNEDKFAVASGARAICICSFDSESDWWVARQLKKPIRSTVLSIDWHPNNVLLAAGSADMKARVFSAYIKDVDKRPQPTVWGEKLPFNTLCGEYSSASGGWVHSVAFSPSGDVLAFASHDSSVTIVYPGTAGIINIRSTSLPYVSLTWTSENALVAAGHDCQPMVFENTSSGWKATRSLDDTTAPKSASTGRSSAVGRLNSAAFNTFRDADIRGRTSAPGMPGSGTGSESELLTVHQNTITSVRPFEGSRDNVTKVSTSGADGKLVIWNVSAVGGLTGRMGALRT